MVTKKGKHTSNTPSEVLSVATILQNEEAMSKPPLNAHQKKRKSYKDFKTPDSGSDKSNSSGDHRNLIVGKANQFNLSGNPMRANTRSAAAKNRRMQMQK